MVGRGTELRMTDLKDLLNAAEDEVGADRGFVGAIPDRVASQCQKKWYRNMTRYATMKLCKTILERYLAGFTGMGGVGRFPRSIFSIWRKRKLCPRSSLALLAKG